MATVKEMERYLKKNGVLKVVDMVYLDKPRDWRIEFFYYSATMDEDEFNKKYSIDEK